MSKTDILTSTPVEKEQAIKYVKANHKKIKISELVGCSKAKKKILPVKTKAKNPKSDFYCVLLKNTRNH